MILSIAAFILVLGVLVGVHEFGHMLAARACGVGVPEFAIGMGPRLWGFKRGETTYSLRMIPLGGFCAIAGLADDAAEAPGADRSDWDFPAHRQWQSKNGWQKAFILVAGSLMNFLLALVVVIIMGFLGFAQGIVMVSAVEPGSPAAEAGMQTGDILLSLDGEPVENAYQFSAQVQSHVDRELPVVVQRGGEQLTLVATPRVMKGFNDNQASLGIGLAAGVLSTTKITMVQPKTVGYLQKLRVNDIVTAVNGRPINHGWELMACMAPYDKDLQPVDREGRPIPPGGGTPTVVSVQRGAETLEVTLPGDTTSITLGILFEPELVRLPVGPSIVRSLEDAGYMALGVVSMLRMTFSPQVAKTLTGPVGIFSLVGQSVHSGWYSFLQMVMMISFSLGLINLLPIPAVDGGRLVFVALGGIGLRISPQREMAVHLVGLFMLFGLIVLMSIFDLVALVNYSRP